MVDSISDSGKSELDRFVTQLHQVTTRWIVKDMIHVDVDLRSGKQSSPNAAMFSTYLGLTTWCHVFIVIPSWDEVEVTKKNLM